jgi:hypothetical protein
VYARVRARGYVRMWMLACVRACVRARVHQRNSSPGICPLVTDVRVVHLLLLTK